MSERYERIKSIFLSAARLDENERAELLDRECADDNELRREIDALLAADNTGAETVKADLAGAHPTRVDGPPSAPPIPARLGSVELVRQIGRGGMGVVWLGRDTLLERDVAVKFLRNVAPAEDDPGFDAFLEGARAAVAVQHSGLTAIYNAGLHEGLPYLVLEYVDGPPLVDVLHNHEGIGLQATLSLMDKLCDAIAILHDRGILHRDIKPENVLLDKAGRVVVTDFGLVCSRPIGALGSTARVMGTPAYMAPEMFDGTVSTRTDVYALGITMFQLLTGAPPFAGSVGELREKHRDEPVPRERLDEIDEEVGEVIIRATSKQPMYRYKSARHMGEALAHIPRSGAVDLAKLAGQSDGVESRANEERSSDSSTYFEQLEQLARDKRQTKDEVKIEPMVQPAPAGCLDSDIACVQCEYNIRGLPARGECPECGTTLARSLAPDRLIFADRRWLKGVHRGLIRIELALGVFFLFALAAPFAVMGDAEELVTTMAFGTLLLLTGLTCWGTVGVMAIDLHENHPRRVAAMTRGVWGTIALLFGLAGVTLLWKLPEVILGLIFLGSLLAVHAIVPLISLRLWDLAVRIPDPKVARNCRKGFVLTLIAFLVMGGLAIASFLMGLFPRNVVFGIGVFLLFAGIYAVSDVLLRARRRMKRVIGDAVCYDDVAAALAESSAGNNPS